MNFTWNRWHDAIKCSWVRPSLIIGKWFLIVWPYIPYLCHHYCLFSSISMTISPLIKSIMNPGANLKTKKPFWVNYFIYCFHEHLMNDLYPIWSLYDLFIINRVSSLMNNKLWGEIGNIINHFLNQFDKSFGKYKWIHWLKKELGQKIFKLLKGFNICVVSMNDLQWRECLATSGSGTNSVYN